MKIPIRLRLSFQLVHNAGSANITCRCLLLFVFFLFITSQAFSQSVASVSGNWSSTATWGGAAIPTSGSSVTINQGVTVTVDVSNAVCASLQVGTSTLGNGTISFNASSQLTVGGTVTLGTGSNRSGTLTMTNGGTLICNALSVVGSGSAFTPGTGTVQLNATNTLPASVFTAFHHLVINSGTTTTATALTINGDFTVAGGATFNNATNNTAITLQGNLSNAGTFNAGTGLYTLGGSVKTISGTFSVASMTISGSYTNNGTLTVSNALNGLGSLTNGGTGILNLNFSGTPGIATINAVAAGNTVSYGFAGNQTVLPINYHHLSFGGSGTKTLQTGTTSIGGNFSIAGTASTTAVVGLAFGGSVNVAAGTTFNAGSFTYTVVGNWTDNGTTSSQLANVTFNGTSQIIGGSTNVAFNNLSLAGTASVGLGTNLTINGNLTLGNSTTFTAGAYSLSVLGNTVIGGGTSGSMLITSSTGTKTFGGDVTINAGGNWNNSGNAGITAQGSFSSSGTFTAGTGTYSLTGTAKLLAGTLSIPSLSISGSYTNNGTLTVSTSLSGAGSLTNGGTGTLNINFGGTPGITTLSATAIGNTVSYGFAGAQTVLPVNYHHLILSGSGEKTMQAGTATIVGNFTLDGTVSSAPVSALTINGAVTLGNGTSFAGGTFTHTIAGNWTNNGGVFTSLGTIVFSGDGASINGTAATQTFYNVTIQKNTGQSLTIGGSITTITANNVVLGSGNFTVSATLTINGNLTLSTGTFTAGANISVAGNWTNSGANFIHNNGTVTLNGVNQAITGSQTFFNLVKSVTAATTLTFQAGQTQTILGNITLNGTSGNLLSLVSSNPGVQWMINPQGTHTISFVSTSYSNNNNGTAITAINSQDAGNNTNWSFTSTQTWTGAISADWNNAGNWSTNTLPSAFSDVVIPASPTGGRFPTIGAGTFPVRIMTIQTGATVTQTGGILQVNNDWKNSGTYTASGGTIQFTATGSIASNFSTGINNFFGVTINNGVDPKFSQFAGSSIGIAGNYINNNAALAETTNSTVIFNGSGDQSITSLSTNNEFGHVTVNKSIGTLSMQAALKIAGNLSINAGTFSTSAGNYALTIGGGTTFTGGNFLMNESAVSVAGNWTNSGGAISGNGNTISVAGDFIRNSGSITSPNCVLTVGGNWTNNSSGVFTLGSVTLSGSTKTIGGTTATVFPALIVTGSATMNTTCSATAFTIPAGATAASLSVGTGVSFTVNGNAVIQQPTAAVVNALTINTGTVTVTGNLSIGGSNTSAGRISQVVLTTGTMTVSGDIVFNAALSTPQNAVIDQAGGANTVSVGGSLLLTNGSGTITPGSSSTFIYNGTVDQQVQDASAINYNNLFINKAAGTLTLLSDFSSTGSFTLQAGSFSTGASNYALQVGSMLLTAGSLQLNGSVVTVSGNYINNGVAVTGSSCSLTVTGDFTRNGGTLNIGTGTVSVGGNWINNNALAVAAASVTFTGTAKTISGSAAAIFPAIFVTTGSITASINITGTSISLADNNVANSFTVANGVTVTLTGDLVIQQAAGLAAVHSFNVNAGTVSVAGNVTIGVTNNLAGNLARLLITTGTLSIVGNLVMNNTTLAANGVIDMSGGAGNINLSGAFTVNSLGTLTAGTTSTFTYTGTANQTLRQTSAVVFNIVRVNKTGGQLAIAAALTIAGSLQIDQGTFATAGFAFGAKNFTLNGGTFTAGNSTITVNGNWTSNGGTYTSVGTTALRGTGTISGSSVTSFGRLLVGLSSTKTISSNHSCTSLVWENGGGSASFTHTGTAALTISGLVTLQQPNGGNTNAWNLNGGTATASGLITMAGTDTRANRIFRLVITTGTLNAFGGLTMVAASNVGKIIDMSGGAGSFNLKGALTAPANSGTLTAGTAGSIFNFADDANSQTINFFAAGAYHNLHINNTSAGGATLSAAITATNVTGNLRIQNGKLSNNSFAITLGSSKTFEVINSATFVLGGTTGMVTGVSLTKTFSSTSTVNYAGTTQTVTGENYGNLTISGSGTKTLGGSATVNGTLGLSAGTFALASAGYTLTLNGAVGNDGGAMTGSCAANITIGGSGANTTLPGLSVNNFILNRAAGISISGNLSVCSVLTLTAGIIKTNTFSVIIATAGSVTRTTGHVNGNLRKNIATGTNVVRTFEVGGNVNYSPVTITFASVTTAGDLTASATAGDHPNIYTSTVSSSRSAARYWTFTNTATVFTTYSAVFTFATADVDVGANTANFIAGRYAAAAWTYPTVGTRTATSTQVTGLTSFGSFQVGETGTNSIKTWSGGAGTQNWGDAANWSPAGVPNSVDIVDLGGANTININVNAVSNDVRLYNSGLVLTINSGFTYSINGNLTISSGTLNTAQSFPTVSGTVVITGGTVGYTAASGSQTVAAIEYNNLLINGGGTKTLAASMTPAGDLTISGGTFDLGSFTCNRDVEGGTMTIASGATLKIGGTNSLPLNYTTHSIAAGSTIEYAGTNQAIAALRSSQSYGNLLVSGTGTKTLSANITTQSVTISSGTLAMGAYTMDVSGTWTNNALFDGGTGVVIFAGTSTIAGSATTTFKNTVISGTLTAPSGTINVAGSFTNNGTFVHNNGTVNFSGTSAVGGTSTTTFYHVITSGTLTAPAGSMNVAGNWTNTGVFNHNDGTINFNGTISQTIPAVDFNNLTSSSSGPRVLSPSGIITIYGAFTPGTNSYTVTGSTMKFLKDTSQTIPAFTFFNLNVSGYSASGLLTTKTAAGAITVNGAMDIEDSATLNMAAFALGGTMTTANGIGFLQTQNTSASPLPAGVNWEVDVLYNSASAQTVVTGNYTRLTTSGGNRTLAAGTVAIADVFTAGAGTFTTTGNTVTFNGAVDQTIPVLPYNNVTLSGAGTTKTAAGNLVVNGTLTTDAGVIANLQTFTLSGTLTGVSGTGTVRTGNVSATPIPTGKTWTGDVDYYSATAQTIVAGNYGNLLASGGNRTLASSGVIGIAKAFTTGSGTYTVTGSTVLLNGTIDQNLPAFTFQNLTINKTAGTTTLTGDITVNGALTFTLGKIITGTYKTVIASTGSVSGAAQASGWVDGNLQRHFATGTNVSRQFDIGGTLYYAPVTVVIASVSTAGSLVGKTVSTDHPNISTSGISAVRSVNRYWTLTNSGIVFTSATVTFNWNSSVIDAAANTAYFRVARYASAAWTQPSFASPTATTIEANGLTGFGDFQVGELLNINRWTGTISTDWNTTGNWLLNSVPVATNNITIPASAPLFPVISSGTVAITDLVIEAMASLTISSATLQVSGSIDNEGTLTATTGAVEFNGTIAQNIPSGVFANNTIKDLVINNNAGVTLQDSLKLTNTLSVKNGSLYTNGFLVLKSTATSTARVDAITSAAATPISGNVTVERYIQGRRRYRLITSPVSTTASAALGAGQEALSIWAAWQNSGNTLAGNAGTFITGGTAADGFDTQVSTASLYTYDGVNRKWVGFTSALGKKTKYTPVKAGVAYYLFVYGDRKNSLTSSTPNSTVLKATGTLLSGTQTYTTASSLPLNNTVGGFTLLGNPFASPINWATVPRTNLENTYWGWDPNLSGTGGYVTVSTAGGTTLIAPFSGTVGLNQYIQSGQGFFVRTTAASPQLQIRETDKVGTLNNNAFRGAHNQRAADAPNSMPLLAVNLYYENAGTKVLADGALAAFSNAFTRGVTGEDAVKMFPSTESVSIVNGTDFTSIDARPFPLTADTLPLATYRLTKPQYTLEIFTRELTGLSTQAYLEDRYLNTKQLLAFADTNRIVFSVNTTIPASADVARFRIVFEPLVTLPLKFETINAVRKEKKVVVEWATSEDDNVISYTVERSPDAVQFAAMAELSAKKASGYNVYTWTDGLPLKMLNFYRVKAAMKDGRTWLSKTVALQMEDGNAGLTILSNPVKNGSINMQLAGVEAGSYSMVLYNSAGQAVAKKVLNHAGLTASFNWKLSAALPSGVYYLSVSNNQATYRQEVVFE